MGRLAERTHAVRLRLEVDQLQRDASEASQAVAGIGAAAQGAGKQSVAMERLAAGARAVGRTAAAVGTVAVGAMVALGVSTLRTGVAYNTLEQTTRAALGTLLGSAEAAEAQMDKLRDFVENRMFPREAFIEGQQQLLAFGLAAERVIPTLGAIEDAVLATGGSAQRFSEVVEILARVQSTGKVTAGTLNELGRRGINAAQLIGQAMGKTENDIRESITRGSLDGRDAIEILVGAMETRFAGAAEAVANTWVGATGLISAGLRNIGSTAVEAFIDPRGGGAAVVWARDIAEALYAFNRSLRPLVDVLRSRAEPAFAAISDRLAALAAAIDRADFVAMFDTVSRGAPAFAALGAAIGVVGARGLPIIGALAGAVNPLAAGIAALALTSPELRRALFDLLDAFAPLLPVTVDLAAALGPTLSIALSALAAALTPVVALVDVITTGFAALPGPVQTTVVALTAFALLGPKLAAFGTTMMMPLRRLRDEMALQRALHGQVVGGYQRLGDEARKAAPRLSTMGAAAAVAGRGLSVARRGAMGLVGAMGGPWGVALALGIAALGSWAAANAQAKARVEELTATLDDQTGAITENTRTWLANELDRRGALQAAESMGVEIGDLVDGILGEEEALRRVQERLNEFAGSSEDVVVVMRGQNGEVEVGVDLLEELADVVQEAQEKKRRLAEATGEAADAESDFADETEAATDAVEAQTNALKEQHDQIRAMADPMFGLLKAIEDLTSAQDTYNEAVEEHGENSDEAKDASLRLAEAALTLMGAAGEAAGVFNGRLDPAFRALLESAGLTEHQIDQVEEAFRAAAKEGDAFAGDYEARVRVSGAEAAMAKLRDLQRLRDQISAGIRPGLQHGGPVLGPGGIDRVPAMLTAGEHVWTTREVQAAGGHQEVAALRAAVLAGQTRFATGGPVGVPRMQTGGAVGASTATGWHVQNLNVQAWSDRFSLRQVEGELAMHGAS